MFSEIYPTRSVPQQGQTAVPHVPHSCPFLDPCVNCRWKYEAWWGVVPPCCGCPWNRWDPQPMYFPPKTTRQMEITC